MGISPLLFKMRGGNFLRPSYTLSIAVLSLVLVNWLWLMTIQTEHPTNDETGVFK